jgi:hypothetical protein
MDLKVGFGIYNVTPPLGVPMAGYAQRAGGADDVHDELTARAVAFECEGRSAALVAVDTCMLPAEVARRAAARIEERTGIPAGCVIAAAVHTHSGPAFHEENAYQSLLPELLASAVELAWKRREPSRIRYGSGTAKGLCVNRRILGGPVDEGFAFLAVRAPRGRTRGVLFSYPLHGVVMGSNNLAISADYMGVARRVIEEGEPGARAVFVAAPSAEMNPLTPSVKALLKAYGSTWHTNDPLTGIYDRTTGTFREVEQLGRQLGRAVLKALPHAEPVDGSGLVAKTWTMNIGQEAPLEIALGSIQIGDVLIVALPGEHFVATGLALKEMLLSAGRLPILLSHAGQLSYVPTPDAFAKGGYEVELARRKGIATDAQPRILQSVRRELLGG